MKVKIVYGSILLISSVVISCGSSEKEAKKELDSNTITLDPQPGTYAYKPWVILSKKDTGMGSGILYVKTPGQSEFKSAIVFTI